MPDPSSLHYPRIVLAGTHSGSGKTTLALALLAALRRRGLAAQPFKIGPDYIDPLFHHLAAGRTSHNLDAWLASPELLAGLFQRHAPPGPPGISLIEGVMGLFDGLGQSPFAGTAHVAALLRAPVVLVINAQGLSLSAAAMAEGYRNFRPRPDKTGAPKADLAGLDVRGVIFNRVSGPAHYELLRRCIEDNTPLSCLGCLPKDAVPALPQRHLGLVPPEEMRGLDRLFSQLADLADSYLDIPALLALAGAAPPMRKDAPPRLSARQAFPVTVGVPRDSAFSFYYEDNLALLRDMGAELVFFSPLADAALAENLDGLYMGGGFPEIFARVLQDNRSFRSALNTALKQGLPAYAECGAMLYLCEALTPAAEQNRAEEPESFEMAGFFPQKAEMTRKLQPFGYITVTLLQDCLLGPRGRRFPAHEFHYARLREEPADPVCKMEKPDGRSWTGGLRRRNAVAGFPHLHFRGCPEVARSFLSACREYRRKRSGP